jgi:hypothetical protein
MLHALQARRGVIRSGHVTERTHKNRLVRLHVESRVGLHVRLPYCYARRTAKRYGLQVAGRDDFAPTWIERNFAKPMPRKPARIFVNSMSDLADYPEARVVDSTLVIRAPAACSVKSRGPPRAASLHQLAPPSLLSASPGIVPRRDPTGSC